MSGIWTLFRRELSAYFVSPVAYIVLLFFLVVTGASFSLLVDFFNKASTMSGGTEVSVIQAFFQTVFFWFALILIIPIITMRLFAEEKRQGTIETLMTAPVTDIAVVLSKYLASFVFYLILWLPTLCYVFIIRGISKDTTPFEWGTVLGSFAGVVLIGAFYLSIGLFASSLTRNQIIAAVVGFAVIAVLFFCGFLSFLEASGWQQKIIEYISSIEHMREFSRGTVDTRRIVFYLSLTVFMLFLTQRVIESRKWK
jgi:ABC-2 type transport system permease protein